MSTHWTAVYFGGVITGAGGMSAIFCFTWIIAHSRAVTRAQRRELSDPPGRMTS
jgi:hypothetical protein